MLPVSMPNAATASALVDSAAKWRATALSSGAACSSHSRAEAALVIVSSVVKVLEATRNSVVAGSSAFSVSQMSVPSTLETKCTRRWAAA